MRLVGKDLLDKFAAQHAEIRSSLNAWIREVEDADWSGPADVKARYPTASILSENRAVFNIKGNKYRVETKISFEVKVVLARQIGTHAEYMKWTL